MSTIIIVENISKLYRIGAHEKHGSLRDSLTAILRNPLSAIRNGGNQSEDLWALKDVSFDVQQGDIIGIIGRNGAGKSTLLKILSRITSPTTGRIKLHGRVGSLLEVGTGFHPELTGRENVFLNGAILGMKRVEIRSKFDEIVAFAEVERFIDTPVKFYSSGMYVRLAFAVAAHLDPEILIIDEVLAVGDAQFQKKCLGKMGEAASVGRTVIFVSHSPKAVLQLCTKCVWIDHGVVAQKGSAERVVVEYLASMQQKLEESDGTITEAMHYREPHELVFTRVTMVDCEGKPLSSNYFGNPLEFNIEFRVQERLDDVRLCLAIQNFDETVVCALHHTDAGKLGLLNLPPGDYLARMSVDLPLMVGRYNVGLSAHWKGAHWGSGDWPPAYVRSALTFHIEFVSRDGQTVLPTNALLLPTSNWEVAAANGNSL